jgi:hypothetical protein
MCSLGVGVFIAFSSDSVKNRNAQNRAPRTRRRIVGALSDRKPLIDKLAHEVTIVPASDLLTQKEDAEAVELDDIAARIVFSSLMIGMISRRRPCSPV